MKILIISTFFPPLNSIASLRPYSWAKDWSALGHEVTVLTMKKESKNSFDLIKPLDGFNVIEVDAPSFLRRLKRTYHNAQEGQREKYSPMKGIKRLFTKTFQTLRYKFGIFNACRMPDFSDLWIKPALHAIENKGPWDMIVSTSGPYSVHLIAHKIKKTQHSPLYWIADYRDPWSCNHIYPGLFPFNLIEKTLERHILKSADQVTTVSTPLAKVLSKHLKLSNVTAIENGYSPEELEKLPDTVFPDDEIFRIVYTGTVYLGKEDPSPLFEAIKSMSQNHETSALINTLQVIFVGPENSELERLIADYKLERWVTLQGLMPREIAMAMQRDADALLFLPWTDSKIDGILTGKIFEYLSSGTPIMAVGGKKLEVAQSLILEAKAGTILQTPQEIESYLKKKLRRDEEKKYHLDENILKRYDRKHLSQRMLELYES